MYVQGHGKQYYIRRTGKQTGKLEAAVDKSSAQPVEHQKNRKNRRMQGSAPQQKQVLGLSHLELMIIQIARMESSRVTRPCVPSCLSSLLTSLAAPPKAT